MEDEPKMSASTQVTLTLAAIAAVGLASCFPGGLALLGLAGLLGCLVVTSRPDPQGAWVSTTPQPLDSESSWPLPESPPCPTPEIEDGRRWQEAVAARRSTATGRCSSV